MEVARRGTGRARVNWLEMSLLMLRVSPIGHDPTKPPGLTRAVCHACRRERWVTADGRFCMHNDDNGAWCNGSSEAVRT